MNAGSGFASPERKGGSGGEVSEVFPPVTMIQDIYQSICKNQSLVQEWMAKRFDGLRAPIYSSVDMRISDYKVSIVDTNLFPSGFNNLCHVYADEAAKSFQKVLAEYASGPLKILIVPEAHTRNLYYWESVLALMNILRQAGHEIIVGRSTSLDIDLPDRIEVGEESITTIPISRQGESIYAGAEMPDLVLLNNDFSHVFPALLDGISQPVEPSPLLGWHERRKSEHFALYEELVSELATLVGLDPWLLSSLTVPIEGIDVHETASRQDLKLMVDDLMAKIQEKHREHSIASEPYVFIKDNSGTYGMAVTHVSSGDEVLNLGRRKRNKLSSGKGGQNVKNFLLQEGIPTIQRLEGHPVEPVFYLIGAQPIGYFFRIHAERSARESLNAKGVRFDCICSHKVDAHSQLLPADCKTADPVQVVGWCLSQIASYAASLELKEKKVAHSA